MNFTKKVLLVSLTILIYGCDSSQSGYSEKKFHIDSGVSIVRDIPNHNRGLRENIKDRNITLHLTHFENENSTQIDNGNIDNINNIDSNQNQVQNIEPYQTPTVSDSNRDRDRVEPIENSEDEQDIKSKFLKGCNQIVDKEFFEVCYSYDLKVAKAVIYRLEGDLVNELNIKERPNFYEEEQIPEEYRAEYSDYTHSGYDRGHLAPDASFDWSIESLEATYSLANIIPQVPEVNRYGWADLEKYVRDRAVELGYVDVINLVEYNSTSNRIGENQITVSTGYYKLLSNSDEGYSECFYYKNEEPQGDNDSIDNHRVDCNIIR